MSYEFVTKDIVGPERKILKRGTIVEVDFILEMRGFPGLEDKYCAAINDVYVIPADCVHVIGETAVEAIDNGCPHYILQEPGVECLQQDVPVALLELAWGEGPQEVHVVSLSEILSGFQMTLDQFQAKVRSHRSGLYPTGDVILYKKEGAWGMVITDL